MSNAGSWRVIVKHKAEKTLQRLPRDLRQRLAVAIDSLAIEPRPPGSKKLVGEAFYRLRVGDWRIIYAIEDDQLIVLVVKVAPRGGAYRQ
jgi:mRNA interferase RelE/StbE